MIEIPKDILSNNPYLKLRQADMYAVIIESKHQYEDALQTGHCLELVLSGSIDVRSGGHVQGLSVNDIQFRKRGNYQLFPSDNYKSLLIFMENEFVYDFLETHVIERKDEKFNVDLAPYLFKTTDFIAVNRAEAIQHIQHPQEYSRCILRFITHQILLQILSGDSSRTFASFLKYLVSERKIDLVYFMEANFSRQLSLKDMAKLTGRSVSTFKKEFVEKFNTTPIKWQTNRRLEYAEYQIKSSSNTVSMIAYASGFENLSHFSKVYKQKYGVSPTRARD
ncbi:helix-turn-helix transcriptional regulator [Pedobacter sp. PAMC26386]|nr:helix-turn-helix transcriptional regulator [Pedobacter sp. PAMC26386]